jgi:dipeptidyl aminopeptidase/acylaminoacyl peptidase
VVDGVPPIPGDLPEQVGRYTESRAASFQNWHPTRAEMLITTRFGDTNQIHQVTQPGGARTQLTFFPDRVEGGSFEPTKGEYFIFTKGAGGAEFYQNYRYDFATGDITLLTDGKSRNSSPSWSNKGDRIAYTSTRRTGADNDIYVQSPTDPKTDHILAEVKGGGWSVTDWSPDDKQLLVLEYVSVNESYLWLFDAQTGAKKEVTPPSGRRRRKGFVLRSPLFQGRKRNLRYHGPRIGISTAGLHRSGEWETYLPDSGRAFRYRRLGPERRRKTNRLHFQRKRPQHAPPRGRDDDRWRGQARRTQGTGV